MAPRRMKKRPLRMIDPRTLSKGGPNPLLALGGAALGAGVARVATGAKARRSVAADVASKTGWADYADRGPDMNAAMKRQNVKNAAVDVYQKDYKGMGRVDQRKVSIYNTLINDGWSKGTAAKKAGIGRYEMGLLKAKHEAKFRNGGAFQDTAELMSTSSRIRTDAKKTKAMTKGAVAGGALAMLAQLVAAELNKKR